MTLDQRPVLDQLRAIAPVQAVRGNVDSAALGLAAHRSRGDLAASKSTCCTNCPSRNRRSAIGRRQIPWKGNRLSTAAGFWKAFPKTCRVVIFGHSHEPCALILGGKLFFNPGSAGKKRFSLPRCCGLLEISAQGVHATFLGLERYNEDLPEGVMAADRRSESMWKLLKFLKGATEVLTTAGAVLAAAIVVVETYQTLRKKMDAAKGH